LCKSEGRAAVTTAIARLYYAKLDAPIDDINVAILLAQH
jgi:hypothetical protein